MIQLPLLGSTLSSLLGAKGGDTAAAGVALDTLFEGVDAGMAGLPGELQAWLMQLSPQMLQRLEQMVEGGMSLPQAARKLLTGPPGEGGDEMFARLLDRDLTPSGDLAEEPVPPGRAMPRLLPDRGAVPIPLSDQAIDHTQLLQSASATVGAQRPAQLTLPGQLPPQLANSLLQMGVPEQVGSRNWDAALADRVMWMVQGEQQVARLKLNPPNLGPLEVRVSVHQDQTSVAFLAQHAAVREALEAALPRLREMFDQQSLQLVRADVSDPGAQHGDRAHDPATRQRAGGPGWAMDGEHEPAFDNAPRVVHGGNGLVDLFA